MTHGTNKRRWTWATETTPLTKGERSKITLCSSHEAAVQMAAWTGEHVIRVQTID